MPVDARRVGAVPRQSPLRTDAVLTWAMNFAAGAAPPFSPLDPALFDARRGGVALHPLFFASTREVLGAWAALYASGMSAEEVVKHTFAHFTYDAEFALPVAGHCGAARATAWADCQYESAVRLVGVGARRSGALFVTAFETREAQRDSGGGGGGGGGRLVGRSWWGGVTLGSPPARGEMRFLGAEHQPPARPCAPAPAAGEQPLRTARVLVPAAQAHLFDSCIRDPRRAKSRSADINTHTNTRYAEKAGLRARTLNGMALLCFALPEVLCAAGSAAGAPVLARVGCTFGSPVYLAFDAVPVSVRIWRVAHARATAVEERTTTVHFDVLSAEGKASIREGFVVVRRQQQQDERSTNVAKMSRL
jgi:hypothetical protein